MKPINFLFIIFSLGFVMSCGGGSSKNVSIDLNAIIDENSNGSTMEISPESMNSIIESIPSPIEIGMIIRQSGTTFDEDQLNATDNSSLYNTDQAKALAIGLYSGDLGYINIFEKSFLALNYLNIVKGLADDIKIGQFFDFETIRRLASNSNKMDSLIFLSTVNFNKMDSYLRSQKRNNMSILMVTGTWTEGLYFATVSYRKSRSAEIMDWIGNQKVIVDQLLLGLSAFKNDEYFRNLIHEITTLKEFYNNITITYEYKEPESIEVDGRLVIVDKSTSVANITPEQVNQVSELIAGIRNRMAKNL